MLTAATPEAAFDSGPCLGVPCHPYLKLTGVAQGISEQVAERTGARLATINTMDFDPFVPHGLVLVVS